MELKLMSLSISNFKGIAQMTVDFGGDDMRISGANASGKTSIVDAFMWLLFGKDSDGDKDFPIKPKDANGDEIHNLMTEVEGVFMEGGRRLIMRRRMEEKWTRQRGRAEQTYGGNTESFWINDVETKAGEYKKFVTELVGDESVFTLVTSPMAFNDLDWKKRREMLLKISGVDVDAKCAENAGYAAIISELCEMSVSPDELLKIYKDRRKKANDELKMIPVRIDEIHHTMQEVTDQQIRDAKFIIADSEKTLETVEAQIAELQAGSDVSAQRSRVSAAQLDLDAYEHRKSIEAARDVADFDNKAAELMCQIKGAEGSLTAMLNTLNGTCERIAKLEDERARLRTEFTKVTEEVFNPDIVSSVCPTCGQSYPADRFEEMIERAKARFEKDKADRKAKVRTDGVACKAMIDNLTAECEALEQNIRSHEEFLANARKAYEGLGTRPSTIVDYSDDAEHERLVMALEDARSAMQPEGVNDRIRQFTARKFELKEMIERQNAVLMMANAYAAAKVRICDLEEQQKNLGVKISEYETMLMSIEEFIRARSDMLEESVNDLFGGSVVWKLTKTNINGGLEDCCTCFVRNADTGALVPWHKANGAAKVNAGLEIVNVLSGYFNITVPVFVDNAESVNNVIATVGQKICLVVSIDKTLQFEAMKKEAA